MKEPVELTDSQKSHLSLASTGARETGTPAILAIWTTWAFLVVLLALFRPLIGPENSFAGEIAVGFHLLISLLVIAHTFHQSIALIIAGSLALRAALVFWDLNFSDIFLLTNSGADTEMFYAWAVEVGTDLSLLGEDIRGGALSKMFGLLYYLTGPLRVLAQYTNALFGITAVMIIWRVLNDLHMDERGSRRALAVAALLPNALVLSAIFLRESVIALLITISVFHFVRWFQTGRVRHVVLLAAAVLAASIFHAGVIAVGVGYVFVILFYRRDSERFRLGAQSIPYLVIFGAIVVLVVARYPDLFLGKFEAFETEEDLLTATNSRLGGSQYLTSITVESYEELILYGPLRAFYFVASPMPWDFRGASDLFAFFFDSLFYLGTIVLFLKMSRNLPRNERMLGMALLVVVLVSVMVFGAGVSNSGTALRHRFKLSALFFLLAGLLLGRMGGAEMDESRRGVGVEPRSRAGGPRSSVDDDV